MSFSGVIFFLNGTGETTYIVVSHNDAQKNGGPLTILNTTNGKTQKPSVPSIGCSGIASVPNRADTLRVHCIGTQLADTFWDVNTVTGEAVKYATTTQLTEIEGVFQHAKLLIDGRGRQYFNTGVPVLTESGFVTNNPGVIVIDGSTTHTIPLSDSSSQSFILRMVLDEVEDKLWVMSMNQKQVFIDRIDLKTYSIDFTYTSETYSGFDMIVNEEYILLSTYRTSTGTDITILDKFTGQVVKEIQLPVEKDLGYNALSLLAYGDSFLVSSMGGIYTLDKNTFEIMDFIENNPGRQFTYWIKDKDILYAIDSYNRVVEMSIYDLKNPKVLLDAQGQGLTSLFLINR